MNRILDVIVVGLGHQSQEDHLPAIQEISSLRLIGLVDINEVVAKEIGERYGVPYATSIDTLLTQISKPDVAIVVVPHSEYLPIIESLATKGIHIIKEKPFAVSLAEATALFELAEKNNVSIQVTLQRRFNPIFRTFCQLAKRIGKVHSIEARYTMNVKDLSEGWRSKKSTAGGGALIDMGYHYLDLFIWYFGVPQKVKCRMSGHNREGQDYDVEDTVFLDLTYEGEDKNILATLFVSRVYSEKGEGLTAHGSKGSVFVTRGRVARYDSDGTMVEELKRTDSWPSAIIDQLETLTNNIASGSWSKNDHQYVEHTAVLAAAYDSSEQDKTMETKGYLERFTT